MTRRPRSFSQGRPLDPTTTTQLTLTARDSGLDLVHLAFEEERERFGPSDISVFCACWGVVFRWTDCVLWAPKDGGPMFIMPPGINVCFAQDGKALISFRRGRRRRSVRASSAHNISCAGLRRR